MKALATYFKRYLSPLFLKNKSLKKGVSANVLLGGTHFQDSENRKISKPKKVTHCSCSHYLKTSCKVTMEEWRENLSASNPVLCFYFLLVKICHPAISSTCRLSHLAPVVVSEQIPFHESGSSRRDPGFPDVGLWRNSAGHRGSRAVAEVA